MAKYCGKCGGPLDPNTGRCPKCDGTLIQQRSHAPSPAPVPTPKQPLNNKEKKAKKKATMSFGQKVKRFFKRLLIVVLMLAILTGSCAVALVVLDAKGNSFVQNLLGWIGLKENDAESVDNDHFASISGKFTDAKITNADEAIQAAQNAASQLGLQTATDELTLLNENTVGELTYYRLQQNYQGIPVYGKSIVVVADENGDAKNITSNAVDLNSTADSKNNLSNAEISKALYSYFKIEAKSFSKTDNSFLRWYWDEENGMAVLVYLLIVDFGTENYTVLISAEDSRVLFANSNIYYDSAKSTSQDKQGVMREIVVEKESDSRYVLLDKGRNIEIWTCNNGTLQFDSLKITYQGTEYTVRIVNDAWTWDNGSSPPDNIEIKDIVYEPSFSTKEGHAVELISNQAVEMSNTSGVSAMYNAECVYDFYKSILNRKGYNDCESKLYIYVDNNLDGDTTNANSSCMVYYEISRLTFGVDTELKTDLIAHEYTHSVERSISHMNYQGLSGAIMEGYSDVLGELAEDWEADKQLNNSCNWIHGQYGRNMSSPQDGNNPDKYNGKNFQKNLKESDTDHGGVHKNSTVISHAAYLMSCGLNSRYTAIRNDKLARLWYQTLFLLPSNCDFVTLRLYMLQTADMLLDFSDEEKETIKAAFDEVGIEEKDDTAFTYDTNSKIEVWDKNGLIYDDYTIVIDGQEFTDWFKWGLTKKNYHREFSVNTTEPYELNLPIGDYTITIIDNFTGNKSYSKSINAREKQEKKDIEFATAFGFDYSVTANPELQVQDINDTPYDNYSVSITGVRESGTAFSKTFNVHSSEPEKLELETGRYGFLLTDNEDNSKTKSFSVRVRTDAPTGSLRIKTRFGKPYGEYEKTDLPSGAKEYNGHYYYVYDMSGITGWDAAKEFCRAKNGYLATLTSAEENTFVRKLVTDLGFENAYFGLYDSGYNEWKWITNEHVDYTNWASGEPSSNSEHYGMFYNNPAGMWNDGDFGSYTSDDRAFICEWGSFEIADEDVPETPTGRTTSDKRDIVLVLDVSGSMSGDKLEQTKKASVNFINTILQEDASIGIVVYDSSAEQKADFSKNATHLTEVANGLGTGGNTNIEDGLVKAVNMLDYSNAEKQIIVLMSDGEPNCGKIGDELIDYAQTIKDSGTIIYTLGFFGNYSGQSAAQTLMERIASDGCHYEVSDADNLRFFFGDIADTINGQQYIYIRIACPVDVSVTYNGETLNSEVDNLSTRTSFGSLSFEENEKKDSTDGDDRVKVLRLKADDKYDVQIVGNGTGRMNYTIGFMDETGEYSDFRTFSNIKINRRTVIDTVAENTKNTVLNVDEDGDGKYDLKYKAGENERGKLVDYTYLIYIAAALAALIMVLIIAFKIKKAIKNKKGI